MKEGVKEPIPWKVAAASPEAPVHLPRTEYRLGIRQIMVAVAAFAILFTVLLRVGWAIGVFFAVVGLLAIVIGTVIVLVKRRSTQQDGLLWVMSVAARKGMPLGPGIEAYAALCGGGFRVRALYLARMLEQGFPLATAIDRIPGVVPKDAALLARIGSESGTLADALRDASAVRLGRQPFRRALLVRLFYIIGYLLAMQLIFGFILYFIAPKFEAIFRDFGVNLPQITRLALRIGNNPLAFILMGLLYVMEFALLIIVPLVYFGYFGFSIPGSTLVFRRRHTAAILRSLALAVDGGKPITAGLATLANRYPRWLIRRKLAKALEDVQRGADWVRSLWSRGLIRRSDAAVLATAQRVGNVGWALRDLAGGIERRVGYRLAAIIQATFPLLVIALGALVLLFAVAYFLPLIVLVNSLARTV